MKEKFISELLHEILPILLEKIDDEEKGEVQKSYVTYITNTYKNIDVNEFNYQKLAPVFIKKDIAFVKSMSVDQIKSMFLKDENMDRLIALSNRGMDLKLMCINEKKYITTEYAEKCINELKQLLYSVKPYNKTIAQQYVSEGILDYEFAAKITGYNSLRTSVYVENIDKGNKK